jgi:hypothetical protein
MKALDIYGVRKTLRLALWGSALFLALYAGVIVLCCLYPNGLVIAITVCTGLAVFYGIYEMLWVSWLQFVKYEKFPGAPIEVTITHVDPTTGSIKATLIGVYEKDGKAKGGALIGIFNKKFTDEHPDGTTMKAYLLKTEELFLLDRQD